MYARTLLIITATLATFYICIRSAPLADAPMSAYASAIEAQSNTITVGWVGDIVPGDSMMAFDDVSAALSAPDLMIGNLEGTFALPERISKCEALMTMCHAFRGDPLFVQTLQHAGFDFLSLVNNHSYDYGREGLEDTEAVLDAANIPYISQTKPTTSITIKGKKVGILGLSSTEPGSTITDYAFIEREVANLKIMNDFVIVIFHGGAEGADKTTVTGETEYMGSENRGNVELVAHTAIDAGADLVLGSGPHVLRKIEQYEGKLIAYSLGNFYGAEGKLVTTGILGTSGIFHTTLEPDARGGFTSVILSPLGIPSFDPEQRGLRLIESLSN